MPLKGPGEEWEDGNANDIGVAQCFKSECQKNSNSIYFFQIAMLKRVVQKFKSKLGEETGSVTSETSPKTSLAYHKITPISPSFQIDAGGRRVTTSAIVTHENDKETINNRANNNNKPSRLAATPHGTASHVTTSTARRGSAAAPPAESAVASAVPKGASITSPTVSREDWRSVRWKDRESSLESNAHGSGNGSCGLKEVNTSLNRLDRKILHLESLLAKLTDKLSQQTLLTAGHGQACVMVDEQADTEAADDDEDHEESSRV